MKPHHQHSVTPDANRFILLRQRLGWTQQEVAAKAGYSVRLIRKIEKQQSVRPQTLKDIVECYSKAIQDAPLHVEDFILSLPNFASNTAKESGIECDLVIKLREYYDVVYQKRQLHRLSDYVSPSIRFSSEGKSRVGIEAIEQRAKTLLNAFDPIEFLIDRIFSKDQTVIASWTVCMKHIKDFLEIQATGNWVKVRGSSIVTFAEGLAVEGEDQFDLDSLVRQLTGQEHRVI